MARRFTLTAPTVPEDDLHASVADLFRRILQPTVAPWTCFPAGHLPMDARWAVKLHRMGLQPGWPDFLILWNGHLHGIELKRAGAKLSKDRLVRSRKGSLRFVEGQATVFPRLIRAGMSIATCESIDGVMNALNTWGIPHRGVARVAA